MVANDLRNQYRPRFDKANQDLSASLACACERFKSARKEQQCDQGLAFPAFVAKELNVSRKELRHRCDCVQQAGA